MQRKEIRTFFVRSKEEKRRMMKEDAHYGRPSIEKKTIERDLPLLTMMVLGLFEEWCLYMFDDVINYAWFWTCWT